MLDLGFTSLKVPDIWMRKNQKKDGTEILEYVATCVDDFAIAMVNPQFKCKGVRLSTPIVGKQRVTDSLRLKVFGTRNKGRGIHKMFHTSRV